MSASFTPGPWKRTGTNGKEIFIEGNKREWGRLFCSVSCDDCDAMVARANARLIVAAPDLYTCAYLDDTLVQVERHIIGPSTGMQRFMDAGFDNGHASALSGPARQRAVEWLNDKRTAALKKARGE